MEAAPTASFAVKGGHRVVPVILTFLRRRGVGVLLSVGG